jgi:uridine phosphorylase
MTIAIPETITRQYHLGCAPGEVGRYVLLPGDPGRVPLIASFLENAQKIAQHREYTTYTGWLDGEKVSVTSTGIGGPSTAIAVEELVKLGSDTFIRVGTAGLMQPFMQSEDLVVVTAAVRDEGTARHYMPEAFPAIAHLDVAECLRQACQAAGVRYHLGLSHSKDSFYGEVEPERMPLADQLTRDWKAWVMGGVLCSEMEAATLFVVSSVLGKRAGALILALNRDPSDLKPLCAAAVDGVRRLIALDRETAPDGGQHA